MVNAPDRFKEAIVTITTAIQQQPVEPALVETLESGFPADGPLFQELEALCRQGVS